VVLAINNISYQIDREMGKERDREKERGGERERRDRKERHMGRWLKRDRGKGSRDHINREGKKGGEIEGENKEER
jgi:hypothetical protein